LDPDVLSWTFETGPDLDLLYSLFELRNAIESAATALAATRRTKKHLNAMRAAIDKMARLSLATEAGRQADQEFHTALLQASGNLYMISLTSGIVAVINSMTVFRQRARRPLRDPVPDHQRVLDAIRDRDPDKAKKRMSELINFALQDTPLLRGNLPFREWALS
jgi:DNA-binding FadR family transcriptional regulator